MELMGIMTADFVMGADFSRFDRTDIPAVMTADLFIRKLQELQSHEELSKIRRYFKTDAGGYAEATQFLGVKMGHVFDLSKTFVELPLNEIELLLESEIHEARVGAVSIMDFQARNKKISGDHKKDLFDLYIRRHDRIDNWDMVDRSAPYVVGGFLFDKPREILYRLSRSENIWERRTAIVSTYYFIRKGQTADTFAIAEILLNDPNDIINKATGSRLRAAGTKALPQLLDFLNKYAATMPRVTLRYAIEHLEKEQREHYLKLKNN
jgi:3-methyladenine DNA glycosylase AlkD